SRSGEWLLTAFLRAGGSAAQGSRHGPGKRFNLCTKSGSAGVAARGDKLGQVFQGVLTYLEQPDFALNLVDLGSNARALARRCTRELVSKRLHLLLRFLKLLVHFLRRLIKPLILSRRVCGSPLRRCLITGF